MAKLDTKKSIRGLSFFTRMLPSFSRTRTGDQAVFDRRGAINITDKQITKRNGERVKIRGISESGLGGDPMVISRPASADFVNPAKAMEAYRGWVYAAVKPIADEISGIEWRVYVTGKDGEKEESEDDEIIDFLEAVNDFQTGVEFKHMLGSHLELVGNAYILLEGVTDEKSRPTAMYLLNPGNVKVLLNKITYPYRIAGYEFTIDGRIFKYQPYQILHIKYPNPNNPYVGMSSVQGAAEWIDNDSNSTEFLRQFFKNGAQIGVTFTTDMTSEDQLHELRDSFNEQHAGVGNAYKAMFLPKGVARSDQDVKFDDIGMDTISDINRDKILAAFRVSKTILGIAESETNRATADTADYVFSKRNIKPKMLLICSYFNEFLVPRFADNKTLSFTDPVPEDLATQSTQIDAAIGNLPTMTVNEVRAEYLGLEPVEGGDMLLAPNNFAPAIAAGLLPPGTTPPTSADDSIKTKGAIRKRKGKMAFIPTRTSKGKTQAARNAENRKTIASTLAEKLAKIVGEIKKKSLKEMTDDEYEQVILKDKRSRAAAAAEQMKIELVKLNDEQKAEVLKNLESAIKGISKKGIDVSKLFDLDKWINLTINALKPIATELFAKEANHALNLIDKPGLDVANTPSAQQAIKHAMNLMSQSYNQDTVNVLETKLNEGLSQGFGVQKMGELVSDIYQWKNTVAAERVALTESNRITNTAGKIAWKETGVVTEIKWVTSEKENVCVYCQEMDGKTISIEKNFFDRGDTVTGSDGSEMDVDYSDIGGPPLHPNCHCGIRPVVDTTINASAEAPEKEIDDAVKELESLK